MIDIITKLFEHIIDFKFYWRYKRPLSKSNRRVERYMNKVLKLSQNPERNCQAASFKVDAKAVKYCEKVQELQDCIFCESEQIVLVEEAYKLWKPFVHAAFSRNHPQTINVCGKLNATFGYGNRIVVLSFSDRGVSTIGVYIVAPDQDEMLFTRID